MKETPRYGRAEPCECVEGAAGGYPVRRTEASRRARRGLVWAGGGGLSRDLAFWPEDSGILGGSAKMSLTQKENRFSNL